MFWEHCLDNHYFCEILSISDCNILFIQNEYKILYFIRLLYLRWRNLHLIAYNMSAQVKQSKNVTGNISLTEKSLWYCTSFYLFVMTMEISTKIKQIPQSLSERRIHFEGKYLWFFCVLLSLFRLCHFSWPTLFTRTIFAFPSPWKIFPVPTWHSFYLGSFLVRSSCWRFSNGIVEVAHFSSRVFRQIFSLDTFS